MLHLLLRAAPAALLVVACAAPRDAASTTRARATPPPRDASPVAQAASPAVPVPAPAVDDLDALLRHALDHAPEVAAAHARWAALAERIPLAESLPDPTLTYGEFLEELETRAGAQRRRFGLRQAFPWPGTLAARAAVAERRAHAAWHALDAARLDVVETVRRTRDDYAQLGRERAIRAELLELLSGLEQLVASRVRVGDAGLDALIRLQVEIGRGEDELARVERRLPVAAAKLADALGGGVDPTALSVPAQQTPDDEMPPVVDALVAEALARNPRLVALQAEREAARAGEEVADLAARPRVTVGLDYLDTGSAAASSIPDSGDDPVLVTLGLSLPIWGKTNDARRREARAVTSASEARLADAASQLATDVADAAAEGDDATRRFTLYRDVLVPRARSALELTASSYRTGSASIVDLIDAERTVLEFELVASRSARDAQAADARLDTLLGGSR